MMPHREKDKTAPGPDGEGPASGMGQREAELAQNPACAPWKGPYGGVPPFDEVTIEQLGRALYLAMGDHAAQITRIAQSAEEATFDNTIAAMERSGQALKRAVAFLGIFSSSGGGDDLQKLDQEIKPLLAQHWDQIQKTPGLFERIEALHRQRHSSTWSPEQKRFVESAYQHFVRCGAQLGDESRERLSRINERLATLGGQFGRNLRASESTLLFIHDKQELEGLPDSLTSIMKGVAQTAGQPDTWAVVNTRSVVEQILTCSSNRQLRKSVFEMFAGRGDGGSADTTGIVAEIVGLRRERAKLLGAQSPAHLQLQETMAQTPERAQQLMANVWEPALERVKRELDEVREVAKQEGFTDTVEPWDVRYYQEKVRKEHYDLSQAEIAPYLQLEKLRDGMFYVAATLFDISFTKLPTRPASLEAPIATPHPNAEVWEVLNSKGEHIGLFFFNPFHHQGKQSGAWMSSYRAQQKLDGPVTPIVSNDCNFMKAPPGQPTILSWADAVTLFHEFGHALHGLLSDVTYPALSGTNVSGDFSELPSQLFERWLETPEILKQFATHYQTGQPMPPELVEKIIRSQNYNAGFRTVEFLACALIDMDLHTSMDESFEPTSFESESLSRLGMPREIVMRHRLPHFMHIFSSEGASYYSYLWAEALAADAWEVFQRADKGPWNTEIANRFRTAVLSAGNVQKPEQAWRDFRGGEVDVTALMRRRGLVNTPH